MCAVQMIKKGWFTQVVLKCGSEIPRGHWDYLKGSKGPKIFS